MGEYADMAIESMIWGGESWGFRRPKRTPLIKTCKNCGAGNLRWQNVKGGGWALHEVDGTLHACKLKNSFKK